MSVFVPIDNRVCLQVVSLTTVLFSASRSPLPTKSSKYTLPSLSVFDWLRTDDVIALWRAELRRLSTASRIYKVHIYSAH